MSEFLARKVRTFFKHLDMNNDGYISLQDYLDIGERQCDAEKASDVDREKLRAILTKVWRSWMKSAESDDSGLLTASIMAESVKQQRNDPEFKEAFRAVCEMYFRVADLNGDGVLQEDEYRRSVLNSGLKDASVVRRAFEAIDLNQDGKLSFEEYASALVEYLTSEDEKSPITNLWGPLVK